jgi:PEP-CTERM motif
MTNTLRIGLLTLLMAAALVATPLTNGTLNFHGTCTDCPDFGDGVLVVTTVGNVTTFNFTYTSDWITYNMSSPTLSINEVGFTGTGLSFGPGDSLFLLQANVSVTSFGGTGNPLAAGTANLNAFFSLDVTSGNWSTGGIQLLDFGTNGAFTVASASAVPEPSTFVMAAAGAGLVLFRRRRLHAVKP